MLYTALPMRCWPLLVPNSAVFIDTTYACSPLRNLPLIPTRFLSAPGSLLTRSLKPILNGVMDEYKGRIHYVEIDIEVDPEIAEAAGVAGTPTFQLFKDKEQIVSVAGVKLKREYRSFINEALGVPVAV